MTKQINCGGVMIGGGAPITIQSMTNTNNIEDTIAQIKSLEKAGCDIVRISVPTQMAAAEIEEIKKKANIPIVADIHFDYKLAISAIEHGADKIRINPGNLGGKDNLEKVADVARRNGVPIRVGVNAGSIEKDVLKEFGHTPEALAESAFKNVRYLEELDFDDIVVSMKASDVRMTYDAHKILREKVDYPFHIGITEAGTVNGGVIKSAVGIGGLLLAGIGDTMRVSLTGNPVREVEVAKEILKTLGLRDGGIEIVSCPTCARCKVDLEKIALEVEDALKQVDNVDKKITVAVMGCAVNGPGEAKNADFGVACGDGEGVIFKKGEIIEKVQEEDITSKLLSFIK